MDLNSISTVYHNYDSELVNIKINRVKVYVQSKPKTKTRIKQDKAKKQDIIIMAIMWGNMDKNKHYLHYN